MTRSRPSETEELQLAIACPACLAQPGDWCVTYRPTFHAPGLPTQWLHSGRGDKLQTHGWRHGYAAGWNSARYHSQVGLEAAVKILRQSPASMTTFGAIADWLEDTQHARLIPKELDER